MIPRTKPKSTPSGKDGLLDSPMRFLQQLLRKQLPDLRWWYPLVAAWVGGMAEGTAINASAPRWMLAGKRPRLVFSRILVN